MIQRPAGVGAVPVFIAGNKHECYFHQYQFWEITSRGISISVELHRLQAAGAFFVTRIKTTTSCCVVAWRIFWMTMVKRSEPAAAPTIALTQLEIDLLDQLSKSRRSTERGPNSLDHYLDRIARLGGYLGRASDPPPGNIVMWRGLARLTDIAIGFSIREERCG